MNVNKVWYKYNHVLIFTTSDTASEEHVNMPTFPFLCKKLRHDFNGTHLRDECNM